MLGPYRLVKQLGHGGFAPVWLAREVHGKKEFRTVAIKLFHVPAAHAQGAARGISTQGREQIVDEARALCQVEHPNIVRFYSFQTDTTGDVLGIVMEYARGMSVDKRLHEVGKLSVADALALGIAVASALAAVHAVGLVHRDVKPANVVIEQGGVYKLIDFGIAAGDTRGTPSLREGAGARARVTRIVLDDLPLDVKGTKLSLFADALLVKGDETFGGLAAGDMPSGTLGYLDPDCIAHLSRATAASDLYSLAAMLFECLSGLVPAGAAAALAGHAGLAPSVVDGRDAPPSLAEIAPDVPPALATLIDRLLDPVPSRRPASANDVHRALVELRDGLVKVDTASARAPMKSAAVSTRLAPWLAGGAVFATFLGVWWLSRAETPSPSPLAPIASAPRSAPSDAATAPSVARAVAPVVPLVEPPWGVLVAEGQRRLTAGDSAGAVEKFRQSAEQGGGAVARVFAEHVGAATAGGPATGACKLLAFSHPRLGYSAHATGRPSIAATVGGAVVVWTDDHEQAGHDHAYSVMLDETGHPTSSTRDLTPEGDHILRPSLLADGDRVALLYWDASGQYPGVRARWLAEDGRIAGPSMLVDPGRPGNLWPALERTREGFIVAWQDDRNHEGDDVFLRHLDAELQPIGKESRATAVGGHDASAHTPSLARLGDTLLVAYVLDKGDKQRLIKVRRFPIGDADASVAPSSGEPVTLVGDERTSPEAPHIACGKDGCFLVWHTSPAGAFVAMLDVPKHLVRWHKRFAMKGGHPAIGVAPSGELAVAYFDAGTVRVAPLSADGIGEATVIGRVSGDPPRPWIAPGRSPGEWHVTWLAQEENHQEPFAARVACRL